MTCTQTSHRATKVCVGLTGVLKADMQTDLHDQNPDAVGCCLTQVQGLGGTHHNVDDCDHKPAQNQEGHHPVYVLDVLPCTHAGHIGSKLMTLK